MTTHTHHSLCLYFKIVWDCLILKFVTIYKAKAENICDVQTIHVYIQHMLQATEQLQV